MLELRLKELKLVYREAVFSEVLQGFKERRGRRDEIEGCSVNSKVHEFNAQLGLDLLFGLNVVLDEVAHLIYGVHLSLLCNVDPVFEFSVHLDKVLATILQIFQGPVPDLNESVSKDALLYLDSLF